MRLLTIVFAAAAVLTLLTFVFSESISTWILEIFHTNIAYFIIVGIWTLAVTIGVTIVTRNKSIQKTVDVKTAKLSGAIQASEASNTELQEKLSKSYSRIEDLERTNNTLSTTIGRLQTNEKLQREFVDIAAHEIRTPVQPLVGMADLLEVQIEGKDKIEITKAEVELIARNAKRLEHLTTDMLQVARIESGLFKINKDRLSLDDLIYNAIIDAKSQLKEVDYEIKILYEPSGNFIVADKDKLTEVLHNLLSNAVKFTQSGTIAVESQIINSGDDAEDNKLIVRVKDTGGGIDPEILPYMFTKFVTKSESGTGLGLYIAKKIIEAHGGKIWGENNEDGKGATFSFWLPIEDQVEQTRENGPHNNDGAEAQ